jgi:small subunit ribosomal protein S16
MSVKLRFVRIGKKNHPAYRLCAIESRRARDGQYLENLGFYDPYMEDDKKKIRIEKARAEYWLSVGAEPSQTVLDFFRREKISGLIRQRPKRKRRKKSAARAAPGTAGGVAKGATASAKPPRKQKPPKKPKAPKAEARQNAPASPPGGSE